MTLKRSQRIDPETVELQSVSTNPEHKPIEIGPATVDMAIIAQESDEKAANRTGFMANRLPEEQEEKGFRDGRPQELPKCLKRTSRAARHSGPRTASGKFFARRRHGPLAVAAGCALVLASTAGPVHALRFDQYPGCDDLCSEAFWYGAAANDVTAALAGEPASMSYLGHVLRLAVSSGANADAVAVLLRAGAPPNARHDSGERRYVLHDAVLLGTGAPSDRRGDDDDGDRRVREGAAQRSARVVSALLAAGADPRAEDASGLTAIDLARRHGNADALALLQSRSDPPPCGRLCTADFWKSADPEQVRAALTQAGAARGWSPRGDTPLHLALEMAADAESVTILLDGGADPNARNARDDTPLHMAAGTAGNAAAIAILLARGAMLGAANTEDRTPLHVASEHPATIENMRALLDGGADPDIRTGELSGLTPWELAARQPDGPQAMALLLEYGDRSDVVSGSGFEPLLHHAAVGHPIRSRCSSIGVRRRTSGTASAAARSSRPPPRATQRRCACCCGVTRIRIGRSTTDPPSSPEKESGPCTWRSISPRC